jgi:hypothetical protein
MHFSTSAFGNSGTRLAVQQKVVPTEVLTQYVLIHHLQMSTRSMFKVEYSNFVMFMVLSALPCGRDAPTKKLQTELTCYLNPLWSVTNVMFCNG